MQRARQTKGLLLSFRLVCRWPLKAISKPQTMNFPDIKSMMPPAAHSSSHLHAHFYLLLIVADGHQNIRIPSPSPSEGIRTFWASGSGCQSRGDVPTNTTHLAPSIILPAFHGYEAFASSSTPTMADQWRQHPCQCICNEGCPGEGSGGRCAAALHPILGCTIRAGHPHPPPLSINI